MNSGAEILQLTQQFYAAAMSECGWGAALDATVSLLRADHAMIIASTPHGRTAAVAMSAGMHKSDFERFLSPETGGLIAPLRKTPPTGIASIWSQLVPDRNFESSGFYNEVVRPAGGFYGVAAREERPSLSCFVAVCRSRQAGDFITSDAETFQVLLPHLTMALELHCKLRIAEQGRQKFGHVLDRMDVGVILTDARARPTFVNSCAERLLAAEDSVKLDHRGLTATNPEATIRLRAAITAMSSETALETRRIYLKRPLNEPPLLLTVMPIWQFDTAISDIRGPSVAIVIRERKNPMTIGGLDMEGAFQLTDREKEVACLIAGGGLKRAQIANKLGISEATVKTHIEHLFEKTSTHRQMDLVKRLVEHTSSFAG